MIGKCEDSLFYNGRIYTMEGRSKVVRAVAVSGGRIAAVGSDSDARRATSRGSRRVDLKGRTVLPGFIDCHTHFVQMGLDALCVDLSHTRTLEEALKLIKKGATKKHEGEWVIAANWKESGWQNGRFITRQDLDSCCPDNPAVANRVCGHLSTVNSKAIDLLCIDSNTPDADVKTGILRESALALSRKATNPTVAQMEKALSTAIGMAHKLGVTSIQENGRPMELPVYLAAEKRGRLGVRVWFNTHGDDLDARLTIGLPTGLGSDLLKIGGLKVFCDGAIGARTAALSKEYADDKGNKGMLVISREELERIVLDANRADIQVVVHAIGDVGISEVIQAFSKGDKVRSGRSLRNRIEHLELATPAHLREMRRMGVIASMQPNFIGEWGGTEGMYMTRLGPERTAWNNPFREVLRARVKLVFGSDCMPFSPIYGIHSAVNAPHPTQRISVEEAVAAFTRDAAFASFEESVKGTISLGKFADMVVLSADPFDRPSEIGSINVLRTELGGETVYGPGDRGGC